MMLFETRIVSIPRYQSRTESGSGEQAAAETAAAGVPPQDLLGEIGATAASAGAAGAARQILDRLLTPSAAALADQCCSVTALQMQTYMA